MMAELIVVSSIILVVMVAMFSSFNKVYSLYETRINYNDITTLYRLGYYRDVIIENNKLEDVINQSNVEVVQVYNSVGGVVGSVFALPEEYKLSDFADLVFFINNKKEKIDVGEFEDKDLHVTFLDYIDYFNQSVKYDEFDYVMIMERCNKNGESVDHDNCSYAYLEVPESCGEV